MKLLQLALRRRKCIKPFLIWNITKHLDQGFQRSSINFLGCHQGGIHDHVLRSAHSRKIVLEIGTAMVVLLCMESAVGPPAACMHPPFPHNSCHRSYKCMKEANQLTEPHHVSEPMICYVLNRFKMRREKSMVCFMHT
jgi:hypothetical protein